MIYVFDADGAAKYRSSADENRDESTVQDLVARAMAEQRGVNWIISPEDIPISQAYLHDGTLRRRPARPSTLHVWDKSKFEWVDPRTPEQLAEAALEQVRIKRDQLLAESDWVALRAFDTGSPVPWPWRVYRQRLRDITAQPDPFNITWPEAPKP